MLSRCNYTMGSHPGHFPTLWIAILCLCVYFGINDNVNLVLYGKCSTVNTQSKRSGGTVLTRSRDEPYTAESRWGRVLLNRWSDPSSMANLEAEIQKTMQVTFWEQHFEQFLPLQPEKARIRAERLSRKREAHKKQGRERLGPKHGTEMDDLESWKAAFLEDPFKGMRVLPLHTFRDPNKEGDMLLYQLEKQYECGNMQKRCLQLKRLKLMTNQFTFNAGPGDGFSFSLEALKNDLMDDATKLYVPIISSGPGGMGQSDMFLRELQIITDAIDVQGQFRRSGSRIMKEANPL